MGNNALTPRAHLLFIRLCDFLFTLFPPFRPRGADLGFKWSCTDRAIHEYTARPQAPGVAWRGVAWRGVERLRGDHSDRISDNGECLISTRRSKLQGAVEELF